MNKKNKIYIVLTVVTILSIVFIELTKPKKINWFPSYVTHHKIPYGSRVLQSILKKQTDSLTYIDRPPFEYLAKNSIKGNYLFYNNSVSFGESELSTLLDWVNTGNTLFVASKTFEPLLLDTLNLKTKSINTSDNLDIKFQVQLYNKRLNSKGDHFFDKTNSMYYFSSIDTLNTIALGYAKTYSNKSDSLKKEHVNFIKQNFGNGQIILSTFPEAFTNYFILKDENLNYTRGVLAYLHNQNPLYIDEYYKSGKTFYASPMYLFLNNKSLKWAYYSILIAVVFYIVFEGKRKQRAIPVIEPLKNQTLEFSRIISDMYYHNSEHKKMSIHMIQHFLEYIRTQLYFTADPKDEHFIENLAERSHNATGDVKALFDNIATIESKTHITEEQLQTLHSEIQTFKSKYQWKTTT